MELAWSADVLLEIVDSVLEGPPIWPPSSFASAAAVKNFYLQRFVERAKNLAHLVLKNHPVANQKSRLSRFRQIRNRQRCFSG